MEDNRNIRLSGGDRVNKTSKTAPKRALLFGARFILAGVIILVCVLLLFNNLIVTSPLWQVLLNTDRDEIDTGAFVTTLESIELSSKADNNGEVYYDIKDFPTTISWGSVWAYISIEGTNVVKSPVYCGDTEDLLSLGVCKFFGSPFPGEGGNTVLNAHVMQQFYCLEELPIGTKITLDTIYGQYVYEIYDTVIFNENDKSYILVKPDEERLTMYTCYPRGYSYRSQRYAVLCKKLSGVNWR